MKTTKSGNREETDVATVDRIYDTYAHAPRAAGYLNDDSYYETSMEEAIRFHMPAELCSFFSSLICFCLWERHKRDVSEDFINGGFRTGLAETLAFHEIAERAALHSVKLNEVLNVNYPPVADSVNKRSMLRYIEIGCIDYKNQPSGVNV
ncbi:hypothetical protein OESDEN_04740 [Oesophagostomum dentatum]|uniref:Uncharacterized protein n=1 Tax=Oesophagostomum dentatum TaxID=61180 RepID=A0A0B1THM0_OESDE|nr:hypothetical protein OESDEN_04740 [Oesophagostomum dentatum]